MPAPANLYVHPLTSTSAIVSWDAVYPDICCYKLILTQIDDEVTRESYKKQMTEKGEVIEVARATSYQLNDLEPSGLYAVKVAAFSGEQVGRFSSTFFETTGKN